MRTNVLFAILILGVPCWATDAPSTVQPMTAHSTTLQFRGLNAFITLNMAEEKADKVRVVLVNSVFDGNDNTYRMTHIPTIEFKFSSVDPRRLPKPYFVREDGQGDKWYVVYLNDTRVQLVGDSGKVDLADFDDVCNLGTIHGKPDLGRAKNSVWEGTDRRKSVNALVEVVGGALSTESVPGKVDGKDANIADRVAWDGNVSEVVLNALGSRTRAATRIPILANGAVVQIRNLPTFTPGPSTEARHFRDFYHLTKKFFLPKEAVKVEKGTPATDDAFCPPIHLGRP